MSLLDSAAVEQDVDSVPVLENGWDEGGDGGFGGEVGGVDCCFAAESLDGGLCGLIGRVSLDWC